MLDAPAMTKHAATSGVRRISPVMSAITRVCVCS